MRALLQQRWAEGPTERPHATPRQGGAEEEAVDHSTHVAAAPKKCEKIVGKKQWSAGLSFFMCMQLALVGNETAMAFFLRFGAVVVLRRVIEPSHVRS